MKQSVSLADYAETKKIKLRSVSMFRIFLNRNGVVVMTHPIDEWDRFYEKFSKEGVANG